MDRYSILDPGVSQSSPTPKNAESARENDSEWDIQAALQLLANRARYITGAANAIIAVGEGNALVCKASCGSGVPEPETQLQIDGGLTSGLMAECVSTRSPVRCDDTESDGRINADDSREQGIGSVLIAPLIHDNEVIGIFQLAAERKSAFEERDVAALLRLSDAVQAALDEALVGNSERVKTDVKEQPAIDHPPNKFSSIALRSGRIPLPRSRTEQRASDDGVRLTGAQNLRRCKGCGFPVSAGRTLCVDCETAEIAHGRFTETSSALYPYSSEKPKKSWLDEHFYTIGIVLVSVLTLIVLILWAR